MKRFFIIALAFFTLSGTINAQKKKDKNSTNRKELKWDWDGTKSGNATIDKYLFEIDTLYNRVITYKDSIDCFNMCYDTLYVNDKIYVMAHMSDSEGRLVSRSRVNWQCAEAYTQGTNIILDMTNAGLSSASAALALPELGLNAFKFGKYVKGGPAVISEGIKAIKEVRGKWLTNSRNWKSMKDGALPDAAVIGYDGFSDNVIKKLNKCYYIKEINEENQDYAEIIEIRKNKTPEQIAAEAEAIAKQIEAGIVLPEDETKQKEDLPNLDDVMREMGA